MKSKTKRRVSAIAAVGMFLVVCGGLVLCGGCAGYQLGSTLPPELRTIYVPTFINETGEPLLESESTTAAIAEFQKDGTLSVVPEARADLILKVVLTEYRLEAIRFASDNVKTTREYRLLLGGSVTCMKASDQSVIVSRRLVGDTTFLPSGSMAVAKQEALPDAAADLAKDIISSIVEAW